MPKENKFSHNLITTGILSIVILFSSHHNVKSQDIGLGIQSGLEVSTQLNNFQFTSGDLQLDLDPKLTAGYNLGLIYRKRISPNFRIQLEPSILRLGATYNETFTFSGFEFETDSETKLTYLHMPVMFEITTTPPDLKEFPVPWEETTYHVSMGFYGSYLMDAVFSGTNSGDPIGIEFEETFTNDVTNLFNEFNTGLIIGAGLEHGNKNKIGVETRLMLGLLNASPDNQTEFKPNNLSFSFGLYYML